MATGKRLRIFAGPNGSGKSTITGVVSSHVVLGTYVNADEIKKHLTRHRQLDFAEFRIVLDREKFCASLRHSTLSHRMVDVEATLSKISFFSTKLVLHEDYVIEDYFVSFITLYIWDELLDSSNKFTIETVMSHRSKLEFMCRAKEKGFKVYLYFVSLADPELNKAGCRRAWPKEGIPLMRGKLSRDIAGLWKTCMKP